MYFEIPTFLTFIEEKVNLHKMKKMMGVFLVVRKILQNLRHFLLKHLIEHKPLISEECFPKSEYSNFII